MSDLDPVPITGELGGVISGGVQGTIYHTFRAPVPYTPVKDELGFVVNGIFCGLQLGAMAYREAPQKLYKPLALLQSVKRSEIPNVHWPYSPLDFYQIFGGISCMQLNPPVWCPARFPVAAIMGVSQAVTGLFVFDAPLDPVTNPGIVFGCVDWLDYNGEVVPGVAHARVLTPIPYPYRGTVSLIDDEGDKYLTLGAETAGATIYWGTTNEPATEYTAPIAITADIHLYWVVEVNGERGRVQHCLVVEADTPWSKPFPTLDVNEWDDSGDYLLPSWEDTNTYAFRYTWQPSGSPAQPNPRPELRTQPEVGTRYTGPFIPGDTNGTLKVIAYRYGARLSTVAAFSVICKIYQMTAVWDGINTLTLSCSTIGATILYRTTVTGAFTTYNGPISVTATTTFQIAATKTNVTSSDIFIFDITFSGGNPPAEFTKVFTSRHGTESSWVDDWVAVDPQPQPAWYCSPGATGSGRTADDPGSVYDILPLSLSDTGYKVTGGGQFTFTHDSTTGTFTLGLTSTDYLSKRYYGINAPATNLYTTAVACTAGDIINYKCTTDGGTNDLSPEFSSVARAGTALGDITIDWTQDGTLTFTGIPDYLQLRVGYTVETGLQIIEWAQEGVPITIRKARGSGTTTIGCQLYARYTTAGGPSLSPQLFVEVGVTPDFTQTWSPTWQTLWVDYKTWRPDTVCLSQGDYNTTGSVGEVLTIPPNVTVIGGYNNSFTEQSTDDYVTTIYPMRPTDTNSACLRGVLNCVARSLHFKHPLSGTAGSQSSLVYTAIQTSGRFVDCRVLLAAGEYEADYYYATIGGDWYNGVVNIARSSSAWYSVLNMNGKVFNCDLTVSFLNGGDTGPSCISTVTFGDVRHSTINVEVENGTSEVGTNYVLVNCNALIDSTATFNLTSGDIDDEEGPGNGEHSFTQAIVHRISRSTLTLTTTSGDGQSLTNPDYFTYTPGSSYCYNSLLWTRDSEIEVTSTSGNAGTAIHSSPSKYGQSYARLTTGGIQQNTILTGSLVHGSAGGGLEDAGWHSVVIGDVEGGSNTYYYDLRGCNFDGFTEDASSCGGNPVRVDAVAQGYGFYSGLNAGSYPGGQPGAPLPGYETPAAGAPKPHVGRYWEG